MHIWSINFPQRHQEHNGKRTIFSTNGVRKTGQPNAKERNWTSLLHPTPQPTQNGLNT